MSGAGERCHKCPLKKIFKKMITKNRIIINRDGESLQWSAISLAPPSENKLNVECFLES